MEEELAREAFHEGYDVIDVTSFMPGTVWPCYPPPPPAVHAVRSLSKRSLLRMWAQYARGYRIFQSRGVDYAT